MYKNFLNIRKSYLRTIVYKQKQNSHKKIIYSIKMLNLSLNECRLISKSRGINGYKSVCKERLLRDNNESESVERKRILMMQ